MLIAGDGLEAEATNRQAAASIVYKASEYKVSNRVYEGT